MLDQTFWRTRSTRPDARADNPPAPFMVVSAFIAETRGVTAVEFALVAPLLLATILFIMSIGYLLFMSESLDYATQKAARLIKTGQVQAAGLTQAQFVAQDICPLLPSMFNCANVIANVRNVPYAVANYNTVYQSFENAARNGLAVPTLSNSQATYCPGQAQEYVYVQVLYPVNIFLSLIASSVVATTYQGQKAYLIMATATFVNEPFIAAYSGC